MNKKSMGVLLLSAALLLGGTTSTYAYFTGSASSQVISFTTGNIQVKTDDTSENKWRYVPDTCQNNKDYKNDLVDEGKLLSDLGVVSLRPGDAFERDITITNNGKLNSKIKVSKSDFLSNTVYSFKVSAVDESAENRIVKVEDGSYIVENVKPDESFKVRLRLEIPTTITYELIKEKSLETKILSQNPMDMLNIIATQNNNPNWNEN